jgi:hypothetical protein
MKQFSINTYQIYLVLLILILNSNIHAQKSYSINDEIFTEQTIPFSDENNISYLINSSKFDKNKPTAIYFNGSLPVPLIIELNNGGLMMIPFSYFDFSKFLDRFNLILVSKPFVPM